MILHQVFPSTQQILKLKNKTKFFLTENRRSSIKKGKVLLKYHPFITFHQNQTGDNVFSCLLACDSFYFVSFQGSFWYKCLPFGNQKLVFIWWNAIFGLDVSSEEGASSLKTNAYHCLLCSCLWKLCRNLSLHAS